MKKVCFIIRRLDAGGAQRQLSEIVKGLERSKYFITVLTFYDGGLLADDIKQLPHIKYICLEKRGRWDVVSFIYRLATVLHKLQPDILHGYLGPANLLCILAKPLLSKTRIIWGIRASNVDQNHYDWLSRLTGVLERFLSRFADLIIINSRAGRAYHTAQNFPAQKMVVVPNGIDTDLFKPDPEAGMLLRKKWRIDRGTILIGLAARLDPMKDHATFLTAASLVYSKRPDVRFVCIGSGPESYAATLRQRANELGIADKVLWKDTRSDMPAVYSSLDMVTSSSAFGEGFPNVIGEAMSCETPCVVTDVGDSAVIVEKTGIVVPPANPEALAQGWLACLARDRTDMGARARRRIIEHFSVSLLVKRTEAVLTNLA